MHRGQPVKRHNGELSSQPNRSSSLFNNDSHESVLSSVPHCASQQKRANLCGIGEAAAPRYPQKIMGNTLLGILYLEKP